MLYSLMAASRVYLTETKVHVLSCFVGQHMLDYVFNKKERKEKAQYFDGVFKLCFPDTTS